MHSVVRRGLKDMLVEMITRELSDQVLKRSLCRGIPTSASEYDAIL